jgi:uncharacterized protein
MTQVHGRFSLTALARRHPLTVFLALVFGFTTAVLAVALLAQGSDHLERSLLEPLGVDLASAATAAMLILGLFPAALIVTALQGGRPAVRELVRRMFRWRTNLGWWLLALFALPAGTVLLAVLFGDAAQLPSRNVFWRELLALATAFLLYNLPEEAAWAGFFQTQLERRHNFFIAAALTAIPFAAIHLPVQIVNGEVDSAADLGANFLLLLLFGVVMRVFYGMVLRGAANSILLVGLTHTMFNRSNNNDGIGAAILEGENRQFAALLATVLITIVLGVLLRKKLSRSYRHLLDEAEHGPGTAPDRLSANQTISQASLHRPTNASPTSGT